MAVKKTAKKTAKKVVKKSAVKKTSAKKAVKKSAVKKTTKKVAKKAVKKATKKSAAKRSTSSIVIPPVPNSGTRIAAKSINSLPKTPGSASPVKSAAPAKKSSDKSSSRVMLAVIVGIVLLALVVVSRNSSSTKSTTASPEASASASAAPSDQTTPQASAAASAATPSAATAGHSEPQAIVAHYTANGATIFWAAPTETSGLSNYNVEIRSNGGDWKLMSTVPSSQLSIDITKGDATGWSSFRVSSVYSDGQVIGGKVFGLPGQYA